MKSIEATGRTVEEAVAEALQKLNATKDDVDIEVLEEGSKGLLGILGTKPARVVVARRDTLKWRAEQTKEFVENLLNVMEIPCTVTAADRDELVFVEISGENLGLLIGRRGQTLDSLQYLTALAVNRNQENWTRVVLDVEGYRVRREETLRSLARRLAEKALSTHRRVVLDPMNALERRVVHSELQTVNGVETYSEGKDPYRRVVIIPEK